MSPHERLRNARKIAGYRSARAAAAAMGVPQATYTHHESGRRGLSAAAQDRYLAFFAATPAGGAPRGARGRRGGA